MRLPRFMILPALAMLAGCGASGDRAVARNVDANAQEAGNEAAPGPLSPLTVRTARGVVRLDVEVAQTPQARASGLMFRRALAPDSGMLFLFLPPQIAAFWMKDTLIPLDMLFIRVDGTIAMIAPQVQPNTLETVSAGTPVVAVLELKGGRAAELGIKEGDLVNWGACVAPGAPQDRTSAILDFCPGA